MRHQTLAFLPVVALALTGGPASALSCHRPSFASALEDAKSSLQSDFVFVGSLTRTIGPHLPNGDVPMRLTGIELTNNGSPIDIAAVGRATCVEPESFWCGRVVEVERGVFFGTIDGPTGPLVFTFSACNNSIFPYPSPSSVVELGDTIKRLKQEQMAKAVENGTIGEGPSYPPYRVHLGPRTPNVRPTDHP